MCAQNAPDEMQEVFGDVRVYCGGPVAQNVVHIMHPYSLGKAVQVGVVCKHTLSRLKNLAAVLSKRSMLVSALLRVAHFSTTARPLAAHHDKPHTCIFSCVLPRRLCPDYTLEASQKLCP